MRLAIQRKKWLSPAAAVPIAPFPGVTAGRLTPAQLALPPKLRQRTCKASRESREIVKKPTGNVTLFAFDEGQGLSEHTAPFDALVQIVEGEAKIIIYGRSKRLHGGEMILMTANQPHALKALQKFKMILTMIRS